MKAARRGRPRRTAIGRNSVPTMFSSGMERATSYRRLGLCAELRQAATGYRTITGFVLLQVVNEKLASDSPSLAGCARPSGGYGASIMKIAHMTAAAAL